MKTQLVNFCGHAVIIAADISGLALIVPYSSPCSHLIVKVGGNDVKLLKRYKTFTLACRKFDELREQHYNKLQGLLCQA